MTQTMHKQYLLVSALVVASFGPVFFLGSMPETDGPASWTLDVLSFPLDREQQFDAATTRFLSALTGGFLIGWGVTLWALRRWVYDAAPEGVRKAVLVGFLCWFLVDSAGSIASGNPSNVFFNVLVLLLAVGPLWKKAAAPRERNCQAK